MTAHSKHKRDARLHIKLSTRDKIRLERKARKAGLPVSEYVRQRLEI